MAIDFPNSPATNATHTVGGKTWTYSVVTYAIGATGPGGGKVFITPSTAGNSTGKYFEIAPYEWNTGADPTRTWAQSTPVNYQSTAVTGADGTAIGTGYQNTLDIIAQGNSTTSTSAAALAQSYAGGGQTDWFLASKDELYQVYVNRASLGTFTSNYYWSSSENSSIYAYFQGITNGAVQWDAKNNTFYVRPVRSFTTEGGRWVVVDKVNNASNQLYDVTVLLRMETN